MTLGIVIFGIMETTQHRKPVLSYDDWGPMVEFQLERNLLKVILISAIEEIYFDCFQMAIQTQIYTL